MRTAWAGCRPSSDVGMLEKRSSSISIAFDITFRGTSACCKIQVREQIKSLTSFFPVMPSCCIRTYPAVGMRRPDSALQHAV